MMDIAPHLLISGALVAILALSFFLFFLYPAIKHSLRLGKVRKLLQSSDIKKEKNPDQLARVFENDRHLAHLWNEYRKTLYDAIPTSDGVVEPEWRSTVAAESFWNGQLVVDSRVHAEFFKHVPGIFTGLGIIGTFLGLIEGLRNFKVVSLTQTDGAIVQSSVAQTAQKSLESLMHSVGEAFMISAAAISLAMLVTFLEKLLLNSLYAKVDDIAQLLDDKFSAAAAEKFLEQTASHTEEAATQLKQLKSELLKDLTPILQELSEKQAQMLERLALSFQDRIADSSQRQIDASRDNSTELANNISGAIRDGLKGPLDDIKEAVGKATGDQSASAIQMLQDVMTHFSQKLSDLFGGQIAGINELNQRTAQTMQDAVTKLNELVGSLQDAGKNSSAAMAEHMAIAITEMESRQAEITKATQALVGELKSVIEQGQAATSTGVKNSSDEMARRMAETIEKMDQRQESINERTREFVEQIKALVSSSQSDTSTKMQSTLQNLGDQLGSMLQQFQSVQLNSLNQSQQRELETANKTEFAVGALTAHSKEFVSEVGNLLAKTQIETKSSVQSTVEALGSQVAAMLKDFQSVQQDALNSGRQREEQTSNKTQAVVSSMVGSVEDLVKQISESSVRMQESVAALTSVTKSAVSGLADGADQVNSAARNFTTASDKVTTAMNQAATVTTRLSDLTTNVTAASTALQLGIQDYRSHREAVASLVAELNGLVNNAKSDVSMTSNVLQRIEQATAKLSIAQIETEKFMHGVATVLAKAHEEFRTSVTTSLSKSNHEFQQKLASAVGMLSSSIKELDDVLSTATPQGVK